MRFLAWMLVHTVYRVEKSGLEHIPDEGPAVLVCNHVSFVDALVIMGGVPAPDPLRHGPPDLQDAGAELRVPHRARDPDRAAARGSRADGAGLRRRARGRSRRAIWSASSPKAASPTPASCTRSAPASSASSSDTPVPVVPMALRGLWGSFFSRKDGPRDDAAVPPRRLQPHRARGGRARRAGRRDAGGAAGARAQRCAATGGRRCT